MAWVARHEQSTDVTFSSAQSVTRRSGSQKGSRERSGWVTLAPVMMRASSPSASSFSNGS